MTTVSTYHLCTICLNTCNQTYSHSNSVIHAMNEGLPENTQVYVGLHDGHDLFEMLVENKRAT